MLPPISTKEFTVADIGLLSKRVQEHMVAALCEISPHATAKASPRQETPKPAPQSEPLEAAAPLLAPSIPAAGESLEAKANSSTNSSRASSSERRKMSSSEAGTETEEDEGMILVGRPT